MGGDRASLIVRGLFGQSHHDPSEHAHITPALPAIIQRLRRPILDRRITPASPIAIDEDNATQYTKVIHTSTTSALWKVRPQPLHLRLSQPIQIAHNIPQQLGVLNYSNVTSSIS
jgi:hypothetical protein